MLRKPAFWIVFAVVSAAAAEYSLKNFSKAFPLVSVDIRMDRKAALNTARSLATQYGWPPSPFDQAASFGVDQEVQNFVELEGGGKDALRRMISEHTYAPYTWTVRNFKEGDTHEANVRFMPEGEPYGFTIRIPENEKGASLTPEAARTIAEESARNDWKVDFSKYPLAESSQNLRPGGRKDHTFVYERQDIRVGEGRYRLRLTVSGNKLTGLIYFIEVPEAFSRRYAEMRSANDTISTFAIAGLVMYLLGFSGAGLFFMMRRRWVIWKAPVIAGVLVAALSALGDANSWPLVWMNYDTALPATGFALRQLAAILGMFLVNALLFSISFMAAETLSRRAFPHHIQFWKIWSGEAAASSAVLGRTLTGYLTVSLAIGYIIVFYGFTQSRFGWWSPSDTLVDPNVFAAYVPSFSAIAMAAQAGFWEESLFRAVPLAAFALIGTRFGKRRTFLVMGFIVQILVFGSGHAGYANQPSYARVVELIVPSSIFGAYFLAFGLLPGIVMHYAFDAVLMSLPIFAASTARAHVEQALVIITVLLPLLVVIRARLRLGRWVTLPEGFWNRAWTPPVALEYQPPAAISDQPGEIHPNVLRLLPAAALAGLAVWALVTPFRSDVPGIGIQRAAAETAARGALAQHGVHLDSSWAVLARPSAEPSEPDRFVWQTGGREVYRTLIGSYLPPPRWLVRFVRFTGDVADRAEEYQVVVSGNGRINRFRHQLPEGRPGASLVENDARQIAESAVPVAFGLSTTRVSEISAEASKRPARVDWNFEFKDNSNYGLKEGEPRLAVLILGDRAGDANRFIHVPEEWLRNERRERNLPDLLGTMISVLTVGIILASAIAAVIRWSRGREFSVRAFLLIAGAVVLMSLITIPNNWQTTISQFSTAQPYATQVWRTLAIVVGTAFVIGGVLGLAGGLAVGSRRSSSRLDGVWRVAIPSGIILAGARAAGVALTPLREPRWPDFSAVGASVPALAAALAPITAFIILAIVLSLVLYAIEGLTHGWKLRRIFGAVLFLIAGLMMAAARPIETIGSWLLAGVVIGVTLAAADVFVFQFEHRAIVPAIATMSILSIIREGLHEAYPGSVIGALFAIVLVVITTEIFRRHVAARGL